MTVAELIELLKAVEPDLLVKSSTGKEYSSISLFYDTKGHLCLELD